jgi:tetratricopeptide (TPR) repeat protein
MPNKITECGKCGLPWIGTGKCSCGWRPNAHLFYLKIAAVFLALAGVAAGIMFASHYHEFFPDEKAANEHVVVGDDELNHANIPEALRAYEAAVKLAPNNADIRRKNAWAMFNDKNPREALEQLRIAYSLNPNDKQIRKDYSFMLEENGQPAEAAKLYELVVQDKPKDLLQKFHLAEIYERAGDLTKAAEIYSQCTKSMPQVNGPWLGLASSQERAGKKKEAIATLRSALTPLPGDGIIRQRLGMLLGDTNQKQEAIKELTRSAELANGLAAVNSGMIASIASGAKLEQYFIPLTRVGNSYAVEAVLNDTKHVKLLLDPAAYTVCVTPSLAKTLKVSPASMVPLTVQTAEGISVRQTFPLHSISVGAAKELIVPVEVTPEIPGAQGILGVSFLQRYDYTVDEAKKALILRRRSD